MDAVGSTSRGVAVTLSGSEAFVLSDVLDNWERDGTIDRLDEAGRRVLSDLVAAFEPLVDDAFSVDYTAALERARAEVLHS